MIRVAKGIGPNGEQTRRALPRSRNLFKFSSRKVQRPLMPVVRRLIWQEKQVWY